MAVQVAENTDIKYENLLCAILGVPYKHQMVKNYKLVEVCCAACGSKFWLRDWVYRGRVKRNKGGLLYCCRHCSRSLRPRLLEKRKRGYKHDYDKIYEVYDKLKDINLVSYELRIPSVTIRWILGRRLPEEEIR